MQHLDWQQLLPELCDNHARFKIKNRLGTKGVKDGQEPHTIERPPALEKDTERVTQTVGRARARDAEELPGEVEGRDGGGLKRSSARGCCCLGSCGPSSSNAANDEPADFVGCG
mmetsp:Transcript_77682/g.251382  ORF Transcript_77682/g.251382 Transcript_77682/m.251382 type:complete len:114 (-) Transcript_77682:1597-1938(-)